MSSKRRTHECAWMFGKTEKNYMYLPQIKKYSLTFKNNSLTEIEFFVYFRNYSLETS